MPRTNKKNTPSLLLFINLVKMRITLVISFVLIGLGIFSQTTFTSVTSGNWQSCATWGTCPGSTAGTDYPDDADNVVISTGHVVALSGGGGTRTCNDLTIESGAFLTDGNKNLQIDGSVHIDGTYDGSNGKNVIITGGTGTTISGIGTFSGMANFDIDGDVEILAGSDIKIFDNPSNAAVTTINIANNKTLTNNGKLTTDAEIDGGNAGSTFDNNGTLIAGNIVLATGTLDALEIGNTVEYYADVDMDIKTPVSSRYYHLRITGSGIKTQPAALDIYGDLFISGIFDCNDQPIWIWGDWTNEGTFDYGISYVRFQGTRDQYITVNSTNNQFNQLRKYGSATLYLNDDVVVRKILNLNQGIVHTQGNVLTLGTSNTAVDKGVLVYTANAWVYGKFRRWWDNTTGTTVDYPVGTLTHSRLASVTFNTIAGTGGSYCVEFIESSPGNNGFTLTEAGFTFYNTFSEGYWDMTENDGFKCSNYDLDLTGNGMTSFALDNSTRIVTRSDAGSAFSLEGTHAGLAGTILSRTGLSTRGGQYAFADTTNCIPPITGIVTGEDTLCAGVTGEAYSVPNTPGSSYTWTITGGTVASGAGTNSITVDWNPTGLIGEVSVVENNGCTDGDPSAMDVYLESLPTSDITGVNILRENSTGAAYSVTARSGYTYTWVITGGTQASGGTTNSITVDWGGAGTAKVQVVGKSACSVEADTVELLVTLYDVIPSKDNGDWDDPDTWDCGGCTPQPSDNVLINNGHTVKIVANSCITNIDIDAGGVLDCAAKNKHFEIKGHLRCDGTLKGSTSRNITLSGVLKNISGLGTVSNGPANFYITGGDKEILVGSNLLLTSTFDIEEDNIQVVNNGKITIQGSVEGGGVLRVWEQGPNSVLSVKGGIFDGETVSLLYANALENTVNYSGNLSQNIEVPVTSYYHLTASSNNTKITTGNIDVNGDILIEGTAQLDLDHDVTLAGDFTNQSTFGVVADRLLEGTSTLTLDGTLDQLITNTSEETFYGFTINKASGEVNLSTGTIVNIYTGGTMTFTSGIVNTSDPDMVVFQDGALVSGGSNASHINGPSKKIGDDAFVFPSGKGGIWARLGISAPSVTTDVFTAEYFYSGSPNPTNLDVTVNHVSGIEHWDLSRDLGTSTPAVTLYWEDGTRSGVTDLADLIVAHYDSGTSEWENMGSLATGTVGTGTVTSTVAFTSYSPITLSSSGGINPLPIELLTFQVAASEKINQVDIAWHTASETDNDYFEIQRSSDAVHFASIQTIDGAGNSNQSLSYSTIDTDPLPGISYYRLKQVDFDDSFSYSAIRAVNLSNNQANQKILVYPNPTRDDLFVLGKNIEVNQVQLYNSIGQMLNIENLIQKVGENQLVIDGARLKRGFYYVNIGGESFTFNKVE